MHKVLLSGYYGFDNFGDEAILSVLIENLKKDDCDITVISHNPKKTAKNYNVNSLYTFNLLKIFSQMRKTDILFSGGGSLLQDTTSLRSLFYYLFILFLGILFCKKVVIFAQGIGPINNKYAQNATKFILNRVDFVSVRDKKSQEFLDNWGIKSILVDDPVWGVKVEKPFLKPRIGIQLRDWKYMSDDFFVTLVRVIAKDFSDKEIYIYSLQDKQDYEIAMRFENYLHIENPKVSTKVLHSMNVNEIVESMKNLEYLVAMRYHAVMIGLKYGIKTTAINYAPKVETLANYVKIPCIKPNDAAQIQNAMIMMKSLSTLSIKRTIAKKKFSFEPFSEIINS